MRLNRYLKEDTIDLHFDPLAEPEGDPWASGEEDDDEADEAADDEELSPRARFRHKERILQRLVDLLEKSGRLVNPRKCFLDLRNREAKATTGLGSGIAMPHVRTMQARDFAMAVAIAPEPGLWFESVDDEPARIFFAMVAPPHSDRYYLKVERALGKAMADGEELREALLGASSAGEVIRLLSQVVDQT